jgi:hypothetical protein
MDLRLLMTLTITATVSDSFGASTAVTAYAMQSGYNNVNNWPGSTNRPVSSGQTLKWIGPIGGGVSTTSDIQQTATLVSGSIPGNVNGATYVGLDVEGTVTITANNVTMRACRFRGGGYSGINISKAVSGLTIEDCEIDGTGSNDGSGLLPGSPTAGLLGSNCIVRRCNIHSWCNGISFGWGPLTIIDNWINSLLTTSGSGHMNGIQYNGSSIGAINIQHNQIENNNNQTDCVMLDDFYGQVSNVTVNNNRLLGGGDFCIYLDCHFNNTKPVNVVVTNNRFAITSPWYAAGYHDFNPNYPNTYSGNVDDVTGQTVS